MFKAYIGSVNPEKETFDYPCLVTYNGIILLAINSESASEFRGVVLYSPEDPGIDTDTIFNDTGTISEFYIKSKWKKYHGQLTITS